MSYSSDDETLATVAAAAEREAMARRRRRQECSSPKGEARNFSTVRLRCARLGWRESEVAGAAIRTARCLL